MDYPNSNPTYNQLTKSSSRGVPRPSSVALSGFVPNTLTSFGKVNARERANKKKKKHTEHP